MDYELVYFSLIDKAKNRVIPDGVYCERHHIKPSSLGGTNDKDNIVRLYPREHYIAHLLLFKKYEKLYQSDKSYRNEYIKTLWAMSALYYLPSVKTEDCLRKRVFKGNSHIYSEIKEKLSVLNRIRLKERLKSLSEEEKSELYEKISKGVKRARSEQGSWWTGKHHSEKTKKLISETRRNTGTGENNSQYGTFWGMNTETFESRKFKRDETLPDGWVRGRCQNVEKRLEKKKAKEKAKQEKIDLYSRMYEDYCKMPFCEVKKKYNYSYSLPNFVRMCEKYVESFVPQNGKPRYRASDSSKHR